MGFSFYEPPVWATALPTGGPVHGGTVLSIFGAAHAERALDIVRAAGAIGADADGAVIAASRDGRQ